MKYFGEQIPTTTTKREKKVKKIAECMKLYEKSLKCLCMKKEKQEKLTEDSKKKRE